MQKILKFYLYIICLTILLGSSLYAEKVNQIIIKGNERISDETIKIYGEININEAINEKKIDEIIKNLYSTEFFEDINVQIRNKVLTIKLKEYPVINQLYLRGEKSNRIKDEIKKIIKLKEKKSFIKSYLSKDIEIIKRLYSSIGYNFAKVEAKINTIDERNLDLLIEIDKGKETKISSISFVGDKKIKEKRLRDIIASEEDRFYKIISRNKTR